MKTRTFLLVLFLGALHSIQAAPTPTPSTPHFDSSAIQKAYSDGEFDQGIQLATKAWKLGAGLSRADSVFLCKYLAVMLGADNAKRENSKYYMNKMLNLDSTETVMNLYASDAIYAMFATVKTEFHLQQKSAPSPSSSSVARHNNPPPTAKNATGDAAPPHPASRSAKAHPNRSKWLWAIGGTALVGVGVGLIAILSSAPDKQTKEVVMPVPLPQ